MEQLKSYCEEEIEYVVNHNDKKRFSIMVKDSENLIYKENNTSS